MKLRSILLALAATLLIAPSAAVAVTYVVDNVEVSAGSTDGSSSATVPVGATVTIDLTAQNTDNDDLNSLGSAAYGYDGVVVGFVEGTATASFFNTFFSPGPPPMGFGGFNNASGGALSENNGRVNLLQAVSVSPIVGGSELNDVGWDGTPVQDGGSHVQIVFEALADGVTEITLGTDGVGDVIEGPGGLLTPINATVTVNVPEPGALAASLAALGSVVAVVGLRKRA